MHAYNMFIYLECVVDITMMHCLKEEHCSLQYLYNLETQLQGIVYVLGAKMCIKKQQRTTTHIEVYAGIYRYVMCVVSHG